MSQQSKHILVVDDQLGVRRLIQELLKEVGYHVSTAANGGEALDSVASAHPDLVLLDMRMPVLDGLEALRVLRSDYSDVKVIMMTAVGDGDRISEAVNSGALMCINKPFDVFELRCLVDRVLGEEAGA